MEDLISRRAAIDALCELYEYQRAFDPTEAADLVRQGIYLAEKKIEQLQSADHQMWIPCSEKMPKEKEIVLITNDKGNVRFGQFRGTHGKYWIWKGNTLETVLAWMPLPEKYKRGDTND